MLDFYLGLAQTFLPIHAGLDVKFHLSICVAVPGRNRTLFRCILRTHYRLRSAVTQYTAHMSPTLNGSSVLQRFQRGNALEIPNGIVFDFYPGLPHVVLLIHL